MDDTLLKQALYNNNQPNFDRALMMLDAYSSGKLYEICLTKSEYDMIKKWEGWYVRDYLYAYYKGHKIEII